MDSIPATLISELSGKTVQAVHKRAKREGWEYRLVKGRGKPRKEYSLDTMPEDIKVLYNQNQAGALAPLEGAPAPHQPSVAAGSITRPQQAKAMAKSDLLRDYLLYMRRGKWGSKSKRRKTFMKTYNAGLSHPETFKVLGRVSWKTVEGWKSKVKQHSGDTLALADSRGYAKRGRGVLTDQQKEILLQCALHPNRPLVSEAIRMALAVMASRGIPDGRSASTYRRFLTDWRAKNYHIWTFTRRGAKAWNDDCAKYIERDYSLINVGDILVADGHVLNFEVLNPWTGKPKRMTLILFYDMASNMPLGWEIMPTENTQAISAALRRAILRLGKYPQVVYLDNGRAFKARFFRGTDLNQAGLGGLYERLGIKTIFAWPYHAQSKTVERFFRNFTELERWAPTYVGSSLDRKPPRLNRGERLHRRVYDQVLNGGCLTLAQAHKAVAAWFDAYAGRPARGHLAGQRPLDVFTSGKGPGVDPIELVYLMLESSAPRVIGRNGVSFQGRNYYHPALYGRKHKVLFKYDLQDTSAIWIYTLEGEYLCKAEPVAQLHPAARVLGDAEHQAALEEHIKEKRQQEKAAAVLARDLLETEILPAHKRQMEAAGIMPEPGAAGARKGGLKRLPQPKRTQQEKDIEARFKKARDAERRAKAAAEKQHQAEMARIEASLEAATQTTAPGALTTPAAIDLEALEPADVWGQLETMPEADRYRVLIEVEVRQWLMPSRWRNWLAYYEETPEYLKRRDHYEQLKAELVMDCLPEAGRALNR